MIDTPHAVTPTDSRLVELERTKPSDQDARARRRGQWAPVLVTAGGIAALIAMIVSWSTQA